MSVAPVWLSAAAEEPVQDGDLGYRHNTARPSDFGAKDKDGVTFVNGRPHTTRTLVVPLTGITKDDSNLIWFMINQMVP